jgi:Domain of unknown function (DUF4781)
MTYEDKHHRPDDSHQPHWQAPSQHDFYGNPIHSEPNPVPESAPKTSFGISITELQTLIAPANSSYKTNAIDILNQSPRPSAQKNSPSADSSPPSSIIDPFQNIPDLPKQSGKPIPQDIKDEFKPKLVKNQNLNHIQLFEAPEQNAQIGEPEGGAFSHGPNIYTGKNMSKDVLRYEVAHHVHDLQTQQPNRQLRRYARNDDWVSRQGEIARQSVAAERKRIADANAATEHKRIADANAAAVAKAGSDKRKRDDNLRAAQQHRAAQQQTNLNAHPLAKTAPHAKPQSLTPEQQHLLKVQQADEKAKAILQTLPPDVKTANVDLKSKKSLYDQWLDLGKSSLGKGDTKGLEHYFEENKGTLNTLEWMTRAHQAPDSYLAKRYKDYIAPTGNPKDHVELVALKQGSIKELVNQETPEGKRFSSSGAQIVRAITTSDSSGKPVKEYFAKMGGVESWVLDRPAQWVKIKPPSPDQVIVSINAADISQGKQPQTVTSTVNISGAETQTKKRYNTIDANYQTYISPTFTQYQQLRGDTPRQLSGSSLRNELGVAMNFTPNNAPLTETDQKALQSGNWDLFSPDRISPELAQGLNPAQQAKLKEHFKEQHEALSKVEEKVKEIGGDNAKVTTLPIMVDSPDLGGVVQTPLFRVAGKNGKDQFVDKTGRVYQDFQDWKDNNKLPAGRVSYFADGHISEKKDGKPNIVTENTHAVVDTPLEHIKQVGDWVATGVGIVVGVAAVGALILGTGGLATPLVIAGGAAALWGATSEGSKLYDRYDHQESLSLADAEARSAWIGLTANMVGFAAIGSSIRAGNAAMKVANSVDELGQVTASATELSQAGKLAQTSQVLNGASTVTDGVALTDSSYGLAKNWDKLSPEQRLFAIGQIGFWSGMTAHSAHQAMGNNFYASKDVDAFMHGVASRPKESLTNSVMPEARPVVERVQGAVREGFTLSEADAQALKAMSGDGSHLIELSPQLKQQLGIYGKKATTEDVLRRLGAIEKKKQSQETAPKTETVQPTSQGTQPEPQVKRPELIQREQELSQALPKRQQVPVEIDSSLEGNAVRVHYTVDKKGQITDIQIRRVLWRRRGILRSMPAL